MSASDRVRLDTERSGSSVHDKLPVDATTGLPPRAVLVLGMHRSGTSAVTRVLNLLGADLGARLMAPVPGDNEKGYWENLDVVDINERLLAGIGRSWHDVRDMPHRWTDSLAASDAHAAITRFVKGEFATSPLWAAKDPRMCRLAPLWLHSLTHCGVQPGILLVIRHPLEVAASLYVRNGWSRARSLLLWMHHVLEAERATRGYPRAMVTYDQMLTDWRGTMERASNTLRIAWPRSMDEARVDVEASLDVGQRHHRAPPLQAGALVASGFVPVLVAEVFRRCLGVSTNLYVWRHLEELADEFERTSPLFGACFDDLAGYARTTTEGPVGDGEAIRWAALREPLWEPNTLRQLIDQLNVSPSPPDGESFEAVNQSLAQQAAQVQRLSQLVMGQWARIASLEAALAAESENLRCALAVHPQTVKPEVVEQAARVNQQLENLTRLLAAQAETIGGLERQLAKVRPRQIVPRLQRWLGRSDR